MFAPEANATSSTRAYASRVAVPLADGGFDFDHHLLAIAGDLDAMEVAAQQARQLSCRHVTSLDFEAPA